MHPVVTRGGGGLQIDYDELARHFHQICQKHVAKGVKGFAFLFYDQENRARQALTSPEGFKVLNDASGKDISIFYLSNPPGGEKFSVFNRTFMKVLRIRSQAKPPCIVFFRFHQMGGAFIHDIRFCELHDDVQEDHFIVEEARREVNEAIEAWREQGDISALTKIAVPIATVVATLMRAVGLRSP